MAVEVALMVAAAHAAVKAQVARINDLNVYPVPDGDTGTNMLLTLESTLNETEGKTYAGPEEASKAVARAALMGARGNSGCDPLPDDPGRLRGPGRTAHPWTRKLSPPGWKEHASGPTRPSANPWKARCSP